LQGGRTIDAPNSLIVAWAALAEHQTKIFPDPDESTCSVMVLMAVHVQVSWGIVMVQMAVHARLSWNGVDVTQC